MKKIVHMIFFFVSGLYAQTGYEELISKANLLHLQKDVNSIQFFEKAFAIQEPNALSAYKAASVYSLNKDTTKAFLYLNIALDKGYTEIDWLLSDTYFDYLKKESPEKWEVLKQRAIEIENNYAHTLQMPELRKEINRMALTDQQLRYKRAQSNDSTVYSDIDAQINESDFRNLNRAKQIIGQLGWPALSQIGKDAQNNLWLIVQHADQDIKFQRTALRAMQKLKNKEYNFENYAFLYDRVQCNLNYKQLYGTQVNWSQNGRASSFRTISDESGVDKRRAKLGLEPLCIYSLNYGFTYNSIPKSAAGRNEKILHEKVQELIRNAKSAYQSQAYQKTYDFYNEASTFLGEMSENDNYEAAIIFSKIAMVDSDQKYRGIALDFLVLLKLREKLTREMYNNNSFYILHKEPRWADVINE